MAELVEAGMPAAMRRKGTGKGAVNPSLPAPHLHSAAPLPAAAQLRDWACIPRQPGLQWRRRERGAHIRIQARQQAGGRACGCVPPSSQHPLRDEREGAAAPCRCSKHLPGTSPQPSLQHWQPAPRHMLQVCQGLPHLRICVSVPGRRGHVQGLDAGTGHARCRARAARGLWVHPAAALVGHRVARGAWALALQGGRAHRPACACRASWCISMCACVRPASPLPPA